MSKVKQIQARQPKGFQDYLPRIQIARQKLIQKVQECFEFFGFDPLETPGVEQFEILVSDPDEFDARIYRTGSWSSADDQEALLQDTKTALRFDLTVPLARVVAMNLDLPKPFYRYQKGQVWRGEQPQAGRYREFTQFDIDIVGSASLNADVEIMQVIMFTLMKILGEKSFTVSFNSRKILNGLPGLLGFPDSEREDRITDVMRILDKADKVSREEMIGSLQAPRDDGDNKKSPELSQDQIEKLFSFTDLTGSPDELLVQAEKILGNVPIAQEGIQDLKRIISLLDEQGIDRDLWCVDLMLARGLGYYTGAVFEARLDDLPGMGSVFSGGRYDNLIGRFCKEQVPATGASIGIDRLVAALIELGKLENIETQTKVMIINMSEELTGVYFTIAKGCRERGISTRVYPDSHKIKRQFKYANKLGIPFLVIVGSNELEVGKFSVKDMRSGDQIECEMTLLTIGEKVAEQILTMI